MRPVKNLTGLRFSRLTVLEQSGTTPKGAALWLCRCDCGTITAIASHHLQDGTTKSCGCLRKSRMKTHGMFGTRTYATWAGMIQRCTNPRNPAYPDYGGRGIQVCDRWKTFENFLIDMGSAPTGLSLDRINNDGNYEKDNCRWATRTEQNNNSSRNKLITFNGETRTIANWAKAFGLSPYLLRQRIFRDGLPIERALQAPIPSRQHS